MLAASSSLGGRPTGLRASVSTGVGLGIGQALKAKGLSDEVCSMGFGGTGDQIIAHANRYSSEQIGGMTISSSPKRC